MLYKKTYQELRAGYENGDFSVVDVVTEYAARIDKSMLNAFISKTLDRALKDAEESDRRFAEKKPRKLEGFPLAIKDNIAVQGVRATAGSRILENFVPDYESTVTQRLWGAGAILLGKANMDEFAMGSANITSFFGRVCNPWGDGSSVPGGSSGGSAASVAGGLALGSLGTDTGGSVRQPASFCGVVGMRPTYGLCSRFGIVAFASSLDQPGPITRNVWDNALLLEVMAGQDTKDMTTLPHTSYSYTHNFTKDGLKGRKIAFLPTIKSFLSQGVADAYDATLEVVRSAGGELVEASLPLLSEGVYTYLVIAASEASSNLARYDGVRYGFRSQDEGADINQMYGSTRGSGFGAEVQRRILLGTSVLSEGNYEELYGHVQKTRRKVLEDFLRIFKDCDFLLMPTTPNVAFGLDANFSPEEMYQQDTMTVLSALAGMPSVSVPVSLSKGLPVGMQLTADFMQEPDLYSAAYAIESLMDFKLLTDMCDDR